MTLKKGVLIGYTNPLVEVSKDISLEKGVHFLLGKNGKGKTTLLKSLAGLISPLEGEIANKKDKLYLSEDLHFHDELPTKVLLKSMLSKEVLPSALEVAEEMELDVKKPYGKLSTGNKRKVSLILSEFQLHGKKGALIMMDEPLSGLDGEARSYMRQRWSANANEQTRIISYHPDNEEVSLESVLLISNGKLEHIQGDLRWSNLKAKVV